MQPGRAERSTQQKISSSLPLPLPHVSVMFQSANKPPKPPPSSSIFSPLLFLKSLFDKRDLYSQETSAECAASLVLHNAGHTPLPEQDVPCNASSLLLLLLLLLSLYLVILSSARGSTLRREEAVPAPSRRNLFSCRVASQNALNAFFFVL